MAKSVFIPPHIDSAGLRQARAYFEDLRNSIASQEVQGTDDEITVSNGDFANNDPAVIGIEDDPILPGTGSVTLPRGTTGERSTPVNGMIRYNTTIAAVEAYENDSWTSVSSAAGGGDGDIQYNNSGTLAGFGNWDGSIMTVTGDISATGTVTGDVSDSTVTADNGSESRKLDVRFNDYINAADYTSIAAALSQAETESKALYIPAGTYSLTAQLTLSNAAVKIFGDGMGITVLKWTSAATSTGIAVDLDDDAEPFQIEGLSLETEKADSGTALLVDCSAQIVTGSISNRTSPRVIARDIWIRGATGVTTDGWNIGIDLLSCLHCVLDSIHFEGYVNSSEPNYDSDFGIRARGSGAPVEFLVSNSWIYYAAVGIQANGCEGLMVKGCTLIAVTKGIQGTDTAGRPHVLIEGCHINTTEIGIEIDQMAQAIIANNLIYGSIVAAGTTTGIDFINGSDYFQVINNGFENTSTTEDFNAVIVTNGDAGVIDGNVFRDATTCIWLPSTSATNVVIGGSNVFDSTVGNELLDSGSGTNKLGYLASSLDYTDGQLLIGDSSDSTFSKATLTGGTGITVTNGNASITLDADLTTSSTDTFTNKTIDGDSNTLSNLDIGNEVDWAAATDVSDNSAAPASGDKLLLFEDGVGLRKIDWDDLPSGGSNNFIGFRAYNSSATSLTHGADTKVAFQTEDADPQSDYDNATNYRYTPSNAGRYLVHASVNISSTADQKFFVCKIFKNGSSIADNVLVTSGSAQQSSATSVIVDMNGTTDYVEVFAYHETGSNQNTSTGSSNTWFEATYLFDDA